MKDSEETNRKKTSKFVGDAKEAEAIIKLNKIDDENLSDVEKTQMESNENGKT